LTDTDFGRQMEHSFHTYERTTDQVGITNVAFEKLDILWQCRVLVSVDLRDQAIHYAYTGTLLKEFLAEIAPDKAGAAGNKIVGRHACLRCLSLP
jgi:hypothetical protein